MRDVSESILEAYSSSFGIRPVIGLTVYRTRNFFDDDNPNIDDSSPDWIPDVEISSVPIPQDMRYCEDLEKVLTIASYDSSGSGNRLYYGVEGVSGMTLITSGSEPSGYYIPEGNKPSLTCGDGINYIYYVDDDEKLRQMVLNITEVGLSHSNCVTSNDEILDASGFPNCAIHSIGYTTIAVFYIDDGGVRVKRITKSGDTWYEYTQDSRFMSPTYVWTDNHSLNYSAAVKNNTDVDLWEYTFYLSMPDGSVKGVSCNAKGWSDIFDAIPEDLSLFKLTNAFLSENNTIHLVGQFKRYDPVGYFSSNYIYNLDLWSRDGKTFSLDRFTLFGIGDEDSSGSSSSMFGGRYFMQNSDEYSYYGNLNRIATGDLLYSSSGSNASDISLSPSDIIALAGSNEAGYRLSLASSVDLDYVLPKGAVAVINIGVDVSHSGSSPSYEYFIFDTTVIAGMIREYGDGIHNYAIELVPLSLWKTGVMTHPFYLEINSKQSYTSGSSAGFEGLYEVTDSDVLGSDFVIDFWDNGSCEVGHNDGIGTVQNYWTEDLVSSRFLDDYPIITELPLAVKMYGWSRSGYPTSKNNPLDYVNVDDLNDSTHCVLLVEHSTGVQEEIVLTSGSGGSDIWFAQTYKTPSAGGAYPVVLTTAGSALEIGDKIIKIAFRFSSDRGAVDTVHYPERIEIPGLYMYSSYSSGQTWTDATGSVAIPGIMGIEMLRVDSDIDTHFFRLVDNLIWSHRYSFLLEG